MTQPAEILERKQYLSALEERQKMREGLPFLYGWKWYTWAREFYECTNKLQFLCAANQISKSSTQIRKCINWATNQDQWVFLWDHKPIQFWYLYPTGKQASIEFVTKWNQFLPQGDYKHDPVYGWRDEWKHGEIFAIHFNSGVHVYFKTYAQKPEALQTGTVDSVFCDEELPEDLYDELIFRITATNGYFHMVFTATLGQEFWRQCMEPGPNEPELLPEGKKWTISMYDCLQYEDGSKTPWTEEKIQIVKNRCKNKQEVLRRVYGRFVKETGLLYPNFDIKKHIVPVKPLPTDWGIYVGVDLGSGGPKSSKSSIVFTAIRPDMRFGRVITSWIGDQGVTTNGDVVDKFIKMKRELNVQPILQQYDWSAADFFNIASGAGEPFIPAEKGEVGYSLLNVLFKNDMLVLDDTPENRKMAREFTSIRVDTPKRKRKDDLADGCRYSVAKAAWDWTYIGQQLGKDVKKPEPFKRLTPTELVDEQRRQGRARMLEKEAEETLEQEFDTLNEMYGT